MYDMRVLNAGMTLNMCCQALELCMMCDMLLLDAGMTLSTRVNVWTGASGQSHVTTLTLGVRAKQILVKTMVQLQVKLRASRF